MLNCGSAFVERYDIISPVLINSLKSGIPEHAKVLPALIRNSNEESNVFFLRFRSKSAVKVPPTPTALSRDFTSSKL